MAFTEGSADGTLNGVTEVDIVAAPAGATRRLVRWISIVNVDTGPVTVTLGLNNTGSKRVICKVTLAVGDNLYLSDGDVEILDTVNKKIFAKMSAGPTSVNPDFTSGWADAS
jgi:hypothetical protein